MTTFTRKPTTIEAIQWTGKNTNEVKSWLHTVLVADPDLVAKHMNTAIFVKRRGAHMTETLFGNLIPDAKPEVTAAIWVAANDQFVGIVDGEWIARDRLGFYPIADEDGAPMNYEAADG